MTVARQITDERAETIKRIAAQGYTPGGVSDDVARHSIAVERMLCAALGRDWQPSGMSTETLCLDILTELQHRREAEAKPVAWHLTGIDGRISQVTDREGDRDAWLEIGYEVFPLYASPSSPASGVRVKVKPLEWSEHYKGHDLRGGETVTARTIVGRYQVWGDGAWADPHEFHNPGAERGLAVGKTAAQAHFDAAILSALGEHP